MSNKRKVAVVDQSSDSDGEPAPKKMVAKISPQLSPKLKPAKKAAVVDSDDSSEEPAPKVKAKAAPAKKAAVVDSDDSSDEPAPKAKAKVAPAKKAVVDESSDSDEEPAPKKVVAKTSPKPSPKLKPSKKAAAVDSDDSSDEPAPKVKAKAAPAKKAAVVDSDDSSDEPAPKAKAKVAPAKKAVVDESSDSDDEPAPKKVVAKTSPKLSPKLKVSAKHDSSDEEAAAPPAKKQKQTLDVDGAKPTSSSDALTVFIGGIPWSCDEATFKKDFSECGEIERLNLLLNDEGKPKGIAFITYKTKEGVEAALKFNGDDYGGRRLQVNLAGDRPAKGDGKGKSGKGKGNQELTVFVRGLPWATEESQLRKDFGECGDIESFRLPLNDEGKPKGIAFIEYKTQEGLDKALAFNETEYGGRTIGVAKAGEGGKGKDGKGKDGKGKGGKDGKDKGKKGKGKGKSDSMSFAKRDGGIVESTGTKQTFADSDDE